MKCVKKRKKQQTKTALKKEKQLRKRSKDSTLFFPKQHHETKHK